MARSNTQGRKRSKSKGKASKRQTHGRRLGRRGRSKSKGKASKRRTRGRRGGSFIFNKIDPKKRLIKKIKKEKERENKGKQNDKLTKTITFSLFIIFIVYFLSNLFNALGSTNQLHPVLSKSLLPTFIVFLSIIIYQSENIKRLYNYE